MPSKWVQTAAPSFPPIPLVFLSLSIHWRNCNNCPKLGPQSQSNLRHREGHQESRQGEFQGHKSCPPEFLPLFLLCFFKTPTTCQYSVSKDLGKRLGPEDLQPKLMNFFTEEKSSGLAPIAANSAAAPAGNYGVDFLTATTGLQPLNVCC